MANEEFNLQELLQVDAPQERIEELMELVEIDIPDLSDDVKRHLLKQQVEMFNLEYGRYGAQTKITDQIIEDLMVGMIDVHVHGGSDPFERRQLEDEIVIECMKAKMKAVVIKTWYTPSASRNALVQKIADQWAEEHCMTPVMAFGGVTLNYSVGGINAEAVKRCLGFPRFKYVWLPMTDSYYHQLVVFNRKNRGIKCIGDDGKIVPELKEIFHIISDNDLVLASGHYPYRETSIIMEEAKKLGVKRMEIVHPCIIHSKHTIEEMKTMGKEGVKIGLQGIASVNLRYVEGIRWYFKVIKELHEYMVYSSDCGQIQNPTHIEGTKWFIRVLLSYGITKEEIIKIFKINPAEHLGIN